MDLSSSFQTMALYNQRMNAKLIKVCHELEEKKLHQPTGAFFSTIMDHWNHILFGDLIMLQRLVQNGFVDITPNIKKSLPVAKSVNDKFVNTLQGLSELRTTVDAIYVTFSETLTCEKLQSTLVYTTTEGQQLEKNLGEFCLHLFNHQTHHRGQITCLLSQFDLDYGSTDLPVVVSE